MLLLGALATVFGLVLSRSREVADFASSIFGSFVAVTGDAHQAKVAQDIFRQQVRYERSIQIREDMRDVNKLMMESVQTHVIMGSIILGVCWTMAIEGFPPEEAERTAVGLWLVFTCWSVTFTLIALWLALRFQMKMSSSARDRLLRRHRLMVPDDLVVGRMGGHNVVNHVANFHNWMLSAINKMTSSNPKAEEEHIVSARNRRVHNLRVPVESTANETLDIEPLRKGMHAWLHPARDGWSHHALLDIPFFLTGETLVRSPWMFKGEHPLCIRVYGEATLYVAAQCPPLGGKRENSTSNHGLRKALWLAGQVPDWPAEELPMALQGFHEDWRGESGFGEFRRVEGFSMYVDRNDIEMPLYKLVLAKPRKAGFVDVVVRWNFKAGCEALVVVARSGQVHCKEEDWPLAEFNTEVREVLNLRRFSGLFLRHGTSCLVLACCILYFARMSVLLHDAQMWWYEPVLVCVALLPSILAIRIMPLDVWEKESFVAETPSKRANLEEVNVVTPTSSPMPPSLHSPDRPKRQSGVSKTSSEPGALSGPARMLWEERSPERPERPERPRPAPLALPGVEQRPTRARSRSAPPSGIAGCCSDLRVGLENCQVVAHDSPQVTIRNERRQAQLPQPESVFASPQRIEEDSPPQHNLETRAEAAAVTTVMSDPQSPEPLRPLGLRDDSIAVQIGRTQSSESVKSWRRRCFLRFSLGWPKPGLTNGLRLGACVLEILLALSSLAVLIISPLIAGFATSEDLSIALPWTQTPVVWPPLFQPTAAMLSGSELLLAAGPLLRTFRGNPWVAGAPVVLPHSARSLGDWSGHLVALSASGSSASSASSTSSAQSLFVASDAVASGGAGAAASGSALDLLAAPELGGASLPVPKAQGEGGAVLALSEAAAALVLANPQGLQLCRVSNNSKELRVDFVSNLRLPSKGNFTALHLCPAPSCASEPVLWAFDAAARRVVALGFASGRALGAFRVPDNVGRALVTGNGSHLLLVAVGEPSLVFSTPHPALE